ncbi:hypothetical protein K8R03_01595 [Candidatus Kaiserbacteria bacterium]|nr:hypothetical protein [Candidatus Kaiserbacteria bacterium]
MNTALGGSLMRMMLVSLTVLAVILPFAVHAQSASQDDLRATIRAELLKDPRASQLPPNELDAMVNVLAQGATSQGITSGDITWRPAASGVSQQSYEGSSQAFCMGLPAFFCAVSSGFGFDDSNTIIPIALLMTSGLLLFLLYELKHHHKADALAAAAASAPVAQQ